MLHQSILGLVDVIRWRRGIACDCCRRYSQTWRKSFPWSGDVHHGKPSTDEERSALQTQQLDQILVLRVGLEEQNLKNWVYSELVLYDMDFPDGPDGKESACNARFDPWVRKIPWRREWQPNPVFLPRELHGQRSLAGYSLRGAWLDTVHGVIKSQTQLNK